MGMYTELHFNAEICKDAPKEVFEALEYMVSAEDEASFVKINHPLFKTSRWPFMLRCDSYYFPADTHSTFRKDWQGGHYLCIRCNLKNYDGEIEKFIDWIDPYVDAEPGTYLGFHRYEESNVPEHIYKQGDIDA